MDEGPDPLPEHRMPGWVKAFVVAGVVLLVLAIVLLATGIGGPGGHGPDRHLPWADQTWTWLSSGPRA